MNALGKFASSMIITFFGYLSSAYRKFDCQENK